MKVILPPKNFYFFLWLLACHFGYAQPQQVMFNQVEGRNGVFVGKVTGFAQDPQGYMWFADQTQRCITRFDGYRMTSFRNNPTDPNTLGGTYPECIWADSSGVIWIGFFGMGLDRFDPETGKFTHYRHNPKDGTSLSNDSVTAILVDHKGIVWVGNYGGLDQLDPKTGKFIHYQHQPKDNTTLSSNRIRALFEDRQGTLWVGTGSPFDLNRPEEGGLNRFNRTQGNFTRFLHNPKNSRSLINNKVRAIFEDSRGIFWVGTAGDGLHTMNRKDGTFVRHTYDSAKPEKLSRPGVKKSSIYDHITFINEDGAGAIWIGTFQEGLIRYDPVTKKSILYNQKENTASGFNDNSGWVSYTSRDGVFWVSTQLNNLYWVDPVKKVFPHISLGDGISLGNGVSSFQDEGPGVLWIGSDNGLFHQNQDKKTIQHFLPDPRNPASIISNSIFSLYRDKKGTLWVGSINGLSSFNNLKGTINRHQHDPENRYSISNNVIFSMLEDKEGLFWLGTLQGLNQMDRQTGTFKHYLHQSKDSGSLSSNFITSLKEDKAGNIWVGTWLGGGINQFNKQTGKFKHYLGGSNITSILEDTEGVIWTGTENGLYRRLPEAANFTRFIDPASDLGKEKIAGIVEDNDKNLWVSTYSGIYRLNPQRKETRIYGKKYGINANTLAPFNGFKTSWGQILFGTTNGYYAIFPDQVNINPRPPQVLITNFKIANQLVKPGAKSPLKKPLSLTKEIKLKYNQNIFSFDFAGIHYSNPEENRHNYMLKGYDNTWREAGASKTAYYFNVPTGTYSFQVKVTSSDGLWAANSINIIINPPWWATWWAYGIYGVLFIASLWGFIHYRSRRLRQEKRQLEHQINMRTAEVIQQKEEIAAQRNNLGKTLSTLKSTQIQLVQREKMASLGELAAGIAHEIQNPLNFINNFSEVNVELIDELQTEIKMGNTEEAFSISNDIKINEQKINQHGKRADSIVKGMLQHSRASTGNKQPTDINTLVEEYLRLSYHGLRAKNKDFNTKLVTDFDKNLGQVEVIPQELGRVLLNLYNNAFYSTQQKKVQLNGQYQPEVKVTTCQQNGQVEIRVRDNGNGIPEAVRNKIFQPFFTTKPAGQGTGLGLSLSYDIITKTHQGELKVETQEGQYAEFIIHLPVKQLN